MALKTEYLPKIYDGILNFNAKVETNIDTIKAKVDELTGKESRKYIVNHEPKIELPFEEEYEYIRDQINLIRCEGNPATSGDGRRLQLRTHIFLSGYLPNGSTIHFDDTGYAELYINGVKYTSDYTCRATDEGSREKLNITVVQTEPDYINKIAGKLEINYSDMPLKDFKMVVRDGDLAYIYPNIDSFFDSQELDTLICYGDFKWTYNKPSTLRVWKGNKGVVWVKSAYLGNLEEFIFPNIAYMPNLDSNSSEKTNLRKLDISNCRGTVANLQKVQLYDDLTLVCSSISGSAFANANLNIVDTGAYCTTIGESAFQYSVVTHVIIGRSVTRIGKIAFNNCTKLRQLDFKNTNKITFSEGWNFEKCGSLSTVNFSYLSNMQANSFEGCSSLANLTFIDKSISCNLYFNASPVLTEQSCLNIINAIADGATITVSLHSTVKTLMQNSWYCKLENDKYVTCTAEDEGAITQAAAIILRGGTLA